MLSPSTENKTDTIKLTLPVKKVEEDVLQIDNDGKKFSIIVPAYNIIEETNFVIKAIFFVSILFYGTMNKKYRWVAYSRVETEMVRKYAKKRSFLVQREVFKCNLLTPTSAQLDYKRDEYRNI